MRMRRFKMPPSMSLVGLAYACNALGGSLGFVVYLVMRTVDRGGQAGSPIGDLAAVGAGIIGVLAVQVHCPVNLQAHLVSGHASREQPTDFARAPLVVPLEIEN